MNRTDLMKKSWPLIAIPVIDTILLNIVGERGIGPLDAVDAIQAVVVATLLAIIFLQILQSVNKLRTLFIQSAVIAGYTCLVVVSELFGGSNDPTGYGLNARESLFLFVFSQCIISYIVLATKTFAGGTRATLPLVKNARSVDLPKKRSQNVQLMILIAVIEYTVFGIVSSGSIAGGMFDGEIVIMLASLLLAAVNIYLLGRFTGNWQRTLHIHGILVGLCFVTLVVSIIFNSTNGPSSSVTLLSLMVAISLVYSLVSYVVLGIGMYIKTIGEEEGRKK